MFVSWVDANLRCLRQNRTSPPFERMGLQALPRSLARPHSATTRCPSAPPRMNRQARRRQHRATPSRADDGGGGPHNRTHSQLSVRGPLPSMNEQEPQLDLPRREKDGAEASPQGRLCVQTHMAPTNKQDMPRQRRPLFHRSHGWATPTGLAGTAPATTVATEAATAPASWTRTVGGRPRNATPPPPNLARPTPPPRPPPPPPAAAARPVAAAAAPMLLTGTRRPPPRRYPRPWRRPAAPTAVPTPATGGMGTPWQTAPRRSHSPCATASRRQCRTPSRGR